MLTTELVATTLASVPGSSTFHVPPDPVVSGVWSVS